jgi:hypothetical protein
MGSDFGSLNMFSFPSWSTQVHFAVCLLNFVPSAEIHSHMKALVKLGYCHAFGVCDYRWGLDW